MTTSPSIEQPLGEVFVANWSHLKRIAHKIVGTSDRAEDVTQEAYLKLLESGPMSKVERPLCYCCQVVRNAAFDHCRRQTTEAGWRTYTDDGELPQVPCGGGTMDGNLHSRRMLQAVDIALGTLPARTRQAFELHRIEGMTQREIGTCMGVSATLVNFMVKDAMTALEGCRTMFECGTARTRSDEGVRRTKSPTS